MTFHGSVVFAIDSSSPAGPSEGSLNYLLLSQFLPGPCCGTLACDDASRLSVDADAPKASGVSFALLRPYGTGPWIAPHEFSA